MVAATASGSSDKSSTQSRTELDSHANMVVIGKNSVIFDRTGKTCTVNSFSESSGSLHDVPIVDAVIAYDCPYRCKTYLLLLRNCLEVPELEDNLIPPFVLREAGIILDECPKSQSKNPSSETHSIYCPEEDLRIPLSLHNTFSYFPTRAPTDEEIRTCDKIFITPDKTEWDPYSDHYSLNEEAMLDTDGNIVTKIEYKQMVIDDADMTPNISQVEMAIDDVLSHSLDSQMVPESLQDPIDMNQSVPYHEMRELVSALSEEALIGKLSMSLGSTKRKLDLSPLFTSDLDELEAIFTSSISSLKVDKPSGVSSDFLQKIWSITEQQAKDAVESNTQLNRLSSETDLSRRVTTNDRMLRYRRIQSYFYTDTMHVTNSAVSTRGFKHLQVFVSDKGFIAVYPLTKRSEFKDALHSFCKEIGVPISLVVDPAGEQTSREVRRFCNQVGTTLRILEENSQWANRAELYIGFLKESIRNDLRRTDSPMVFWDYCAERRALIHNLTPRDLFQLDKVSPYERQYGVQGDISNLCSFDWYDWCYYREVSTNLFPLPRQLLGRVLGPSKNEGNEMAQNILTHKGKVVPRRSFRRLTESELQSEVEKRKRDRFDEIIRRKFGDSLQLASSKDTPKLDSEDDEHFFDSRDDDGEEHHDWIDGDPTDPHTGKPSFENSLSDTLINCEVLLPQGEDLQRATVKGRSKSGIGEYHTSPELNSILYDVEFPDGTVKEYAANIIAQNMYSTVDADGHTQLVLDEILDHRKDHRAISKADKFIITKKGNKRLRKSTVGWTIKVRWKDGTEDWVPLKIIKEHYPVQISEYSVANKIDSESAFCWWVPHTLKKRDVILSSVKARMRDTRIK